MIGRRGFITGLVSLVAAPAIVRVGSIMPVRVMAPGIRYHAISIEEMIESMAGGPAVSAAWIDLMAFGTATVAVGAGGLTHVPQAWLNR